MSLLINRIKKKLINKLKLKNVEVIDNTELHAKHKFFNKKKLHLKLIISSPELKKKNQIESSRIIYSTLKDEMKKNIHSLQIKFN